MTFEAQTVHVRDLKGMRYLARLLADPGREFHVLDLVAAETGSGAPVNRSPVRPLPPSALGDAAAMLDGRAKDAYRRRLAEIEDDDARKLSPSETTNGLSGGTAERDFLVQRTGAVGLGGRDRRAASASERAQSGRDHAIRQAITRVADHHPPLGKHLNHAPIRTGTYSAYSPDPHTPSRWGS